MESICYNRILDDGEDMVGIRLRGLPFTASESDLTGFFKGYKIIPSTIKFGQNEEGRPTGQAACLFENKDDAKFAFSERNGQNMGHRWIELYTISRKEWKLFGSEQTQSKNTNLKNYLNDDNIYRAVKLRGMPFHISPGDIVEFFRDFNVTP